MTTVSVAIALPSSVTSCKESQPEPTEKLTTGLKGKINHSVCKWCYDNTPLERLIEFGQDIGLTSIDLLEPDEWVVTVQKGLTCAMANGSPLGITKGFNDQQYHEQLLSDYIERLPIAAESGLTNMICFSGNHHATSEQDGLDICATGLEPVLKEAQKYGITICMELLNSKVDHAGYQCDHTAWGVQLVEKLGMDNFKLLYDIYHMQIMEGDVIDTIRKNKDYIGHYHTGGVPGRNEIDETQELYYPAIMRAIADTGYEGFVAQEFIPTWENPLEALKKGIDICDV